MSVDCRIAFVIVFGLVGGQDRNGTYNDDDDFITTSTDSPDDSYNTSSLKPEIIGAVIGAFLLLVIMAGVILTIINGRRKTSLHHRPPTHFMMYSVSVTPKFAQTLKESMNGSLPRSSSNSMTPSRHSLVDPTRSMHIHWRISENHSGCMDMRSSVSLRSARVEQRYEQSDEQGDSEMVVSTSAPSYENEGIRTFSRETLQPPSYDDAISTSGNNDVNPPPYYYNT